MQESICAVVVTYNRKAVLKKCLEALLSQTRPADQIVVIDIRQPEDMSDEEKKLYDEMTEKVA